MTKCTYCGRGDAKCLLTVRKGSSEKVEASKRKQDRERALRSIEVCRKVEAREAETQEYRDSVREHREFLERSLENAEVLKRVFRREET